MGVEEAGEEVPVAKVDIKCGWYFCGEFLKVCVFISYKPLIKPLMYDDGSLVLTVLPRVYV